MTTLRIPAEQPWQVSSPRQARTVAQIVRAGWGWVQRVLLALALTLFLTLGVLPRLGLYRPVTVLSGSMRPTFSPGDMVIVTAEPVSAVRVGQVISYQVPTGIHQVETHRIVKILQGGAHPVIQTQGDANNWPDPWTAKLEGKTAWRIQEGRQPPLIRSLAYEGNSGDRLCGLTGAGAPARSSCAHPAGQPATRGGSRSVNPCSKSGSCRVIVVRWRRER
jgi:signal peptidase I